jgi:O-antigen ligase
LLSAGWLFERARAGRLAAALSAPIALAGGAYVLMVVVSVAFSAEPERSLRALPGLCIFLLLPITLDLVERPAQGRMLLLAFGASAITLALIGLWQFAHGADDLQNRIRGPLSHYMTYSGLTMAGTCVLLGILFEERTPRRLLGLTALLPAAATLLTFTRNAYVGLLAAVAAYFALRRPKGLLFLVPAFLLVFVLAPRDVRDRIRSITDLSDPTNRDRIAMVRAGARMVADRPLFGVGPELVKSYYTLYRDPDAPRWRVGHLHNNAMQIAAESGLFAAAAYLFLLGLFFARVLAGLRRETSRERSTLMAASLLAGVALSVAGLFEYNFGDKEVLMATLPLLALPFSRAFSDDR